MQFSIKRDILLKSLTLAQGVIERKNTLPILSNVLLEAKNNKLIVVATDLDIIFYDEITEIEIIKEGSTTTSATILYDILRKISQDSSVKFDLKTENKINLTSSNSDFNLLCLPPENFPSFGNNFNEEKIILDSSKFLSLLNKTKIAVSNDDTRHYLNGIFLHLTESKNQIFLTGVATDSHRLSSSSLEKEKNQSNISLILPKKTVYQLCTLLQEINEKVVLQVAENKIQFTIGNTKLISKVIDGKFPDYKKVVPTNNEKTLITENKNFIDSIERVTTVSLDRKEGVKLVLTKDKIKLSVNSALSGEGNEVVKADFNSEEMTVSFNSKYLIDIASQLEDKNIKMVLKDSISPVLVQDNGDKNSYYVIMPMKI